MPDLTHAAFGPYRILEQIGAGGTSKVYKAYRPGLDRLVVVKVIFEHLAQDPHFIQRFRQESQLIARLEHRAIVPIYDVGEQGGQIYLVMRYVPAGTVHDLLSYSPFHPRDIVSFINDIASALDYAHSQGVIHRDIKPGNVLIDKHGHAFLTDFGFAKVMAASVEITRSGDTVGTPAYMAPEQTLARPVTPQTDVYSLGAMIYELLTGQLPFRAETPIAQALKHVHAPVPRPRQFNPALSEATEGVILKALEKLPEDRYPTAGALAEALQQAVALEPPAPNLLPEIAGAIAGGKGSEEVTPDLRQTIQRRERVGYWQRARPWVARLGLGVLFLSLLLGLTFAGSEILRERTAANQTATAIGGLLNQLSVAQTLGASDGGDNVQPTLDFLLTQIKGVPDNSLQPSESPRLTAASLTHTPALTSTPTQARTVTSTVRVTNRPTTPPTRTLAPSSTGSVLAVTATHPAGTAVTPTSAYTAPPAPTATHTAAPTLTSLPSNTPQPTSTPTSFVPCLPLLCTPTP